MPRRAASQVNKPLAIFATILIVAGVVAVVAVSSEFKNATTPPSLKNRNNTATSTASTGPYASGTVLLINDSAVTLVRLDATSERVTPEQFSVRFKDEVLPTEGSDVANGTKAYFHLPSSSASSSSASPSPDGKMTAELRVSKSGVASVDVTHGDEHPQSIVLRDTKNRALQNVSLLGWLDDRTFAVTGASTSSPALYTVTTDGSITWRAALPETAMWGDARGGGAWYATAVMGEGIESAPHGPSELHRVDSDGTDVVVSRDALHIYNSAVPGPDGQFAATTDDGQSFILSQRDASLRVALGKLRPLIFLPGNTLLVRDGYNLAVFDIERKISRTIGALPEGHVTAFFVP